MKGFTQFMNRINQHGDVIRIDLRMDTVSEVEYMARARTVGFQNSGNLLPDDIRSRV